VKDERIRIFHLISLCHKILQRREGVKDATGILFLKWTDSPVKGAETISLSAILCSATSQVHSYAAKVDV